MANKVVAPSITLRSFSCPVCGALADQRWLSVHAHSLGENKTPSRTTLDYLKQVEQDRKLDAGIRDSVIKYIKRLIAGDVFIEAYGQTKYVDHGVHNLAISECYSCKEVTIWRDDKVLYPPVRSGDAPNDDLPDDIKRDFEEARTILDLSPRGAAALLRLSIQKLCGHLGEDAGNINNAIAGLVSKGLPTQIQKALDIVRVVGNDSVHPGTMDLRDDRETAIELFKLVNLIADRMVTEPKKIEEMYGRLPEAKRKAIEARDAKAANSKT